MGAVGFAVAVALPVWLWHGVIADIARAGTPDSLGLLVASWAPWALMALGLACFAPIVLADLRDREHRFHRRGTGAWAGWGISLYLLGFGLAAQVAQIHALHS